MLTEYRFYTVLAAAFAVDMFGQNGGHCSALPTAWLFSHAIKKYGKPDVLHTDRETQFVSKRFYKFMKAEGITHSMSRPHRSSDNAQIETFWKSMKAEIRSTEDYTGEDFEIIAKYYGYYYNTIHPHSALNYLSPLAHMNLKNVI